MWQKFLSLAFPPALLVPTKMIGLASVTFCNGETRVSHASQQLTASASHCPCWLLCTSGEAGRGWKCMRHQGNAAVTAEEQTLYRRLCFLYLLLLLLLFFFLLLSYPPVALKFNSNSNGINTGYKIISLHICHILYVLARKIVCGVVSSVRVWRVVVFTIVLFSRVSPTILCAVKYFRTCSEVQKSNYIRVHRCTQSSRVILYISSPLKY